MSADAKGIALLSALLITCLSVAAPATTQSEPARVATSKVSEGDDTNLREKLRRARQAINHNDRQQLQKLKTELKDYPLAAYIDYWSISERLHRLPLKDVDQFLAQNKDTAIGDWMQIRLLRQLGNQKQFETFLRYFQPAKHHRASLRCYYANALSQQGGQQPTQQLISELWLVGRSQVKECDPVFAKWIKGGGLTQELAWKRHLLAIEADNLDLARYIAKKMTPSQAQKAKLLQSIHRSPNKLLTHSAFAHNPLEYRGIVLHGLHQLAKKDAGKAEAAWHRYQASYLFSDAEQETMFKHLAQQFARQDNMQRLQQLVEHHAVTGARTIEWLARQSLRELNWQQVAFWIDRLPVEQQQLDRWLYWKARCLDELYGQGSSEASSHLYRKAARNRSYYGFLAADTLGQQYSFEHRPAPITPIQVQDMANRPALLRARELQAIGELFHARREWRYATKTMDHQELLAAGKVASAWGWYHKSIQSVLAAEYLDDLELRFPLAFADIVHDVSKQVGAQSSPLEPYLIYAVARQESHFSHDAKSSSGALGLMQLLPSTAKATAQRAGVRYRRSWDLLSPSTNIALGSFYLSTLLNRFDNNRFLAAAAYNAGPTRVAGWLKETRKQLPYDVWIETIPYKETRNYVQNVLAYTVIYAYRSGTKLQLLRENEAASRL
ncbi:transglycosylase SLT domain-containing protein [Microbulbifer sp. OS29]|uniref:Transglycosylase SLT domain-containing protein n=1 Tax=Microbulbifer okhotskensis TaxID=2926617 RepID=A0A9X2J3X6_9GAMM|nr:transglycosylase SLT domain-containing protein [Microbulbifer okhotskensis]MCO1333523.1 transglycosylase SLT domain-containing protein [Microbulbifer okhotskensis]